MADKVKKMYLMIMVRNVIVENGTYGMGDDSPIAAYHQIIVPVTSKELDD